MTGPESAPDLKNEFNDLLKPNEWIASTDCAASKVYWIRSRRVSSIAICNRDSEGRAVFTGLREELNSYDLDREIHYDDDEFFGTALPFVEMGNAPDIMDERGLMEWLLEQMIDLAETKLEWLKRMPSKYQETNAYRYELEDAKEGLKWLTQLKSEGFDAQEPITFKSIMSKGKKLPSTD